MGALLDEVRHRYDFVILDTPALLPVTDAAAVAARADGTVLVVRYDRTAEEQVADAVGGLEAVGAPLLGVVLAGTPGTRMIQRDRFRVLPGAGRGLGRTAPRPRRRFGRSPAADAVVPAPPRLRVGCDGRRAAAQRPQQTAQANGDAADGAENHNGSNGSNG